MAMNNSLAEVHPELITEWSEKNLPLTPDDITFGSNKKVWWRGACGHEWQASISGVSFSVNGNKLTVSMDTAPSKEFTITATKKNAVRRGVVVWSEGKHGQNSSVQDVVSYAQEVSDSINGFVKMKVSYGSCQIVTVTRKHLSRQCLMYLRWRLRQPMNFRIRIWQLSIIMKSRPCM